MPSHSPIRAATAGLRSREVKPDSSGTRTLISDRPQHREPAAVVLEVLDPCEARRPRERLDRVGRHLGPPERPAGVVGRPESGPSGSGCPPPGARGRPPPGRPGATQVPRPLQQPGGVSPDADVAVGQQRGPPRALLRQRREDVAHPGGQAAQRGHRRRLGHHVDREHPLSARGEVLGHPARTAAQVERRARRSARARPGPRRRRRRSSRRPAAASSGRRATPRGSPARAGRRRRRTGTSSPRRGAASGRSPAP